MAASGIPPPHVGRYGGDSITTNSPFKLRFAVAVISSAGLPRRNS